MRAKATYTTAELAAMSGLSRYQVYRLIVRDGVRTFGSGGRGGRFFISRIALLREYPDLLESIELCGSSCPPRER